MIYLKMCSLFNYHIPAHCCTLSILLFIYFKITLKANVEVFAEKAQAYFTGNYKNDKMGKIILIPVDSDV